MDLTEQLVWEGRSIAWGRAGTGPAVVLCHGTPFSSRVWSRYADTLSRDHTVYLWDMPGYGTSSMDPEHAVDFDAQAKAFAALLGHWQLARPHVVAHDFGGAVALRTTLFEGAAFASLLLVDAVAVPPIGSPFFRFVREQPALAQLPAYIHEAVVRAYVQRASHLGLPAAALDELVAPWTTEAGQRAFYRQIADFDEQLLVEIEQHLDELGCPVRVVWGADDAWIPVEHGRRLAGLIHGADFIEVPDAGHLIQHDAPVALTDLVRTWLDRQTTERTT